MRTLHDQDIRDRAYALWQEHGSPEGRDEEFWQRAERELSEEADVDISEETAEVSRPNPPAGFPSH